MTRTFIEVPLFTKRWKEIGLDDNDLHSLQIMLLKDPESGPVMEGTGGIRKVRFPLENKGKSGSVRVCYTDFAEYEMLYLATVYKGNIIKNLIMDCQSYTKYRPNETTGGIFVSWRRKEELPTGGLTEKLSLFFHAKKQEVNAYGR